MKIILTGGHLTPAYAFAEMAQSNRDNLMMIGSLDQRSVEYSEMMRLGIEYRRIIATKFDRHHKLISLLKLPLLGISLFQSIQILKKFRPNVVVTFGSYNAVPVALAAYCLRIPYITHEQTQTIGFANRILAMGATAKAVSYEVTKSAYSDKNVMVTGNMLRRAVWVPPKESPFPFTDKKPILFITGGNQGSQTIIDAITPLLLMWSETYQIVIQYGKTNLNSSNLPDNIWRKPWFCTEETSWLLHHAHLVISRGGANTIGELMVAGTPSIIIPLPNTTGDEQTKNAAVIVEKSAGIAVNQSRLNPQVLQDSVDQLEKNYSQYANAAKKLRILQDENAAKKLYQMTTQLVK